MSKLKKTIENFNNSAVFLNRDGTIDIVDFRHIEERTYDRAPEYIMIPVDPSNPKYIFADTTCFDIKRFHITFQIEMQESMEGEYDDCESSPLFFKLNTFDVDCTNFLDIYRFINSIISLRAVSVSLYIEDYRMQPEFWINHINYVIERNDGTIEKCDPDSLKIDYGISNFYCLLNDILVGKDCNLILDANEIPKIMVSHDFTEWDYYDETLDPENPDSIPGELITEGWLIGVLCSHFLSVKFVPVEDILYLAMTKLVSISCLKYSIRPGDLESDFYLCTGMVYDSEKYDCYDARSNNAVDPFIMIKYLAYAESFANVYNMDFKLFDGLFDLDGALIQVDALCNDNYVYFCTEIDDIPNLKTTIYHKIMKRIKSIIDGKTPKYIKSRIQLTNNPGFRPF